jgi:DNA-binding MarR family transcriptional regulator
MIDLVAINSHIEPEIKEVLRAYLDAVALVEPMQARLWKQARLTLSQTRLLRRLRRGPRGLGELAELGHSPAALTRLIDRLEDRGLVSRQRDVDDRRRVVVRLEAAGQRLVGETRMLRDSGVHRAIEAMTADDRARLLVSLRALVDAVRARSSDEAEDLAASEVS